MPIQEQSPEILVHWSDCSAVMDPGGSAAFFDCYRSAAFLGRPFGVCTDDMLAAAAKKGRGARPFARARLVLLPAPVRLTNAARAGVRALAKEGVRILATGRLPLKDEYGETREATGIDLLNAVEDTGIFAALRPIVAQFPEEGRVFLRGADGLPGVWGVETHGYVKEGFAYLSAINHLIEDAAIVLPEPGRDLLTGAALPTRLTLSSERLLFATW